MVIVRNDVDVTLNNGQNMDIEDIVDEDELNEKFNEFEQLNDVSLSYYEEVKFTKVITSSNQTNRNTVPGVANGDYFLLLGQTTTTENGFYLQNGSTATKQSTPTVNTVYYNNTNMGLFSTKLDKFIVSYSRRIFLYKTFTSDTEQTVYNIPHFSSTPITVNLDLIGANNTFSDNISVENTQRFFNNGSSIISMGDYDSDTTKTGTMFSTKPTITYDTNVADTITLKITPNATGGTFYVRAVVTL